MEVESYTVGTAKTTEALSQGVNGMIMKGWIPTGGIGVAQVMSEEGPVTLYIQAMVKPKPTILVPRR